MKLLACIVPVCPVRNDASHKSEMVSQLLFGERCYEIERTPDFVKVKMAYDNYEGWCQQNQLTKAGNKPATFEDALLSSGWVNEITINAKQMHIPFGSSVNPNLHIGSSAFKYGGSMIDPSQNEVTETSLQSVAFKFLNTSYLWGGRSVFGIDCSGFTQMVFKFFAIPLLRDASQQATQGEEIKHLQNTRWGDLAFFNNEALRITHVGILLNTTTIIHASGQVRVDGIDDLGIVNSDNGKRTHKLCLIKRMIVS